MRTFASLDVESPRQQHQLGAIKDIMVRHRAPWQRSLAGLTVQHLACSVIRTVLRIIAQGRKLGFHGGVVVR